MLCKNGKQLAVGETVDVYEDPLTEERLEGRARITKIHAVRGNVAWCEVRFKGEGLAYPRQICVYTAEERIRRV